MPRLTPFVLAFFLACAAAVPAAASSRDAAPSNVIAQKSVKNGLQGIYLAHGLLSGRTYRIEIVSKGHVGVTGQGFMNYTYMANHSLMQQTKSFVLQGKTPYSYTVKPPTSAPLSQWSLVVDARITGKHSLTVRYRDLGVRK